MSDKRYFPLSSVDTAARMNLILRVHGLEQVENYFNSIPSQLKKFQVHVALLNCYAHEKCVDKANAVLQKIKEMGFDGTPLPYNIMMNLYYQVGEFEKLDHLLQEMEEKGVLYDGFTYSIRLSAYAAASDIEGVNKIVEQMESDSNIVLDWSCYVIAANGYLKVGLVDKLVSMLRKSEGLLATAKRRGSAFDILLKLYAKSGKKDELHRIWNLYKKEKVYNKGYISMIKSLLILNDVEAAEHIFKEWETRKLSYDLRIPNMLIDAYCREGLMEKAEAFINKTMTVRGKFSVHSWCYLSSGYIRKDQLPQAVDTLKKAAILCPSELNHLKEILATSLDGKEDVKEAEKAIDLLRAEANSIFAHDVFECDDECA